MKRIGGLKQQVAAGMQELTVDGRTPQQQIAECYAAIARRSSARSAQLLRELLARARASTASASRRYDELVRGGAGRRCASTTASNIFPLVTPQAIDPAHPFPFISNLSLNLLVTLRYPNDTEPLLARVKVPVGAGIPRFLRVGDARTLRAARGRDGAQPRPAVPGMEIDACELFRVTRNANTERDEEEADDLLAMIESELRDRRFAPIVRLEVRTRHEPGAPRHARRRARPRRAAPTSSRSTACWRCAT